MDLTREVGYRGFALNSVEMETGTSNLSGCEIVSVEMADVPGVGYDEKRAMADGYDASDVFLGKRIVLLSGVLYGLNRSLLYDAVAALTDVLAPNDAYEADPLQRGYHILDFYDPTADAANHPSGMIRKIVFARPMATPSFKFASDMHGGADTQPLAMRWTARLECRDPRIYGYALRAQDVDVAGTPTVPNLGTRPAPITLTLNVSAGGSGLFVISGAGVGSVGISVQSSGSNYTLIYNSHDKTLYRNGVLRMDLLDAVTHIMIPAGGAAVSISPPGGALFNSSEFVYRDTWA